MTMATIQRRGAGPFSVPDWALQLATLVAIVVAVVAVHQLRKTDFQLRASEHRQIQQVASSIIAVLAGLRVGQSLGLGLGGALLVGVGAGAVIWPGGAAVVRRRARLRALRPRSRLVYGWVGVLILASVLPAFSAGKAAVYTAAATQMVVFAALADSMALLRELAKSDGERVSVAAD